MLHSPFLSALPLAFMGLCLLLALSVLLPLRKQGDERRRLILSRAAACSFCPALLLLAANSILSLLGLGWTLTPFFALCVLCLFFTGALTHFSRKYGD